MELFVSLSLAFGLSIGLNIWLARRVKALQQKVAQRDSLIDDLRGAIGGVEDREDWRTQVL